MTEAATSAEKQRRLSKDEWEVARTLWENDPLLTYAKLAADLGISKPGVFKYAQRNGWEKRVDNSVIVQKATAIANRASAQRKVNEPPEVNLHVNETSSAPPKGTESPPKEPEPYVLPAQVAADTAHEMAGIITKHRIEWKYLRALGYEGIKAKDFDKMRLAKISIEAFKILQDGERKAWGLEPGAVPATPLTVILERG